MRASTFIRPAVVVAFTTAMAVACTTAESGAPSANESGTAGAMPSSTGETGPTDTPPVTIVVLGDTQQTLESEVLLGREVNDDERAVIIAAAAAEDPDAVIHVGDLVGHGESDEHWAHFDEFFAPITALQGPMFPVLGNHEYCSTDLGCARRHEPHDADLGRVYERFEAMNDRPWYAQRIQDVAFVFIDTNFWEYGVVLDPRGGPDTTPAFQQQLDWFSQTLQTLDDDPAVTTVVVVGHHPMWSNADFLHADNPLAPVLESEDLAYLRDAFLTAIIEAAKPRLYISGHAHGFEHFREGDVDFLVTGGAGGPRPEYLPPREAPFEDLYAQGTQPRPFNYLRIVHEGGVFRVEVHGMDKGETQVGLLYELETSPP